MCLKWFFKKNKKEEIIEEVTPMYSESYWNNKWPKAPIIYGGRALRGKEERIGVDVKNFITTNDAILEEIVKKYKLKKKNANDTAYAVQKFVVKFLTYKYDEESSNCPEFWQFPFESIQSGIGDCEDGAILITALLIQAGVEPHRCKVAAGNVKSSPTAPEGGHGYAIFLADRPDTKNKQDWVILDWCYYEDSKIHPSKKPLARDGGYKGCYKKVWFTFNNEYSWNQESLTLSQRISEHHTKKLEEVTFTAKTMKAIVEHVKFLMKK